jgi:hypothetical protein
MTNNEIKVKLLRRARELIESDSEDYICQALFTAGLWQYQTQTQELQKLIMDRLDGHYTLISWLVARGYKVWSDDDGRGSSMEKLRRTRLAWVDSLIEEHSN